MKKSSKKSHKHNKKKYQNKSKNFVIFVGGLSNQMTVQNLSFFFNQITTSDVNIKMKKKNKRTGKIGGFCYLSTKNRKVYNQLIKLKNIDFMGRNLILKPYLTGEKLKEFRANVFNRRIFLIGLPISLSNSDLCTILEANFGPLEDAYAIEGKDFEGQRIGLAVFEAEKTAKNAIQQGWVLIRNENKSIYVKIEEISKKPNLEKNETESENENQKKGQNYKNSNNSAEDFYKGKKNLKILKNLNQPDFRESYPEINYNLAQNDPYLQSGVRPWSPFLQDASERQRLAKAEEGNNLISRENSNMIFQNQGIFFGDRKNPQILRNQNHHFGFYNRRLVWDEPKELRFLTRRVDPNHRLLSNIRLNWEMKG